MLAFERHATSKLQRRQGSALRSRRSGSAAKRCPRSPPCRGSLLETQSAEEDHRNPHRDRGRQAAALRRSRARPAARRSPSATCSSTCRPARSSSAPSRPNWRTSPRSSPTTAWRIRTRAFELLHEGQGTARRDSGGRNSASASSRSSAARRLEDLVEIGCARRDARTAAPRPHGRRRAAKCSPALLACVDSSASPQVQKLNRNSIYLFVNGRLIRDRLLLHAISSAYHNLMPAGLLSVRAAVSRMRLRGGGRQRASVENRGPFPPRNLRARFRPRHDPARADRAAVRSRASRPVPSLGQARRTPGPAQRPRFPTPNSPRRLRTTALASPSRNRARADAQLPPMDEQPRGDPRVHAATATRAAPRGSISAAHPFR